MNIITEVFDLVGQCLIEMMKAILLYGSAGLVLGIILIVLGNKIGLFKRENILFRIVVIIYFMYIPMLFAYTTAAFGAIYTAEEFTKEQAIAKVISLTKTTFPAYQMFLKFNWNRIVGSKMNFKSSMDEYLAFMQFLPKEDSWWERQKAQLANEVVPQVAIWCMESVVHTARRMVVEETSNAIGVDKKKVENAMELALEMDIDVYKEKFWNLVEEETNDRIHSFYSKFYWLLGIKFLLLMIIPILEITVSYFLRRSSSNK